MHDAILTYIEIVKNIQRAVETLFWLSHSEAE